MEYGFLSIVPALLAVILAFVTREAVFSLLMACIAGVFILNLGVFGLTDILMKSLGTPDFIWVLLIEILLVF